MSNTAVNPFFKYENSSLPLGFEIPDYSMFGMFRITAENQPDSLAYEYFGTKCTYKSLMEKIEGISGAYFSLGVRRGDIVTIIMPNTPEAVISIYALNRIGAVANILHPLSAQEEIKNHINRVKSKVVLCVDICTEKLTAILDETTSELGDQQFRDDYGWSEEMIEMKNSMQELANDNPFIDVSTGVSADCGELLDTQLRSSARGIPWNETYDSIYATLDIMLEDANNNSIEE